MQIELGDDYDFDADPGLNPYSNGMWIEHFILVYYASPWPKCLNPYSNGMWIEQLIARAKKIKPLSLNPYSNGMWIEPGSIILRMFMDGLNPYSNGMWIERNNVKKILSEVVVLILILMECG